MQPNGRWKAKRALYINSHNLRALVPRLFRFSDSEKRNDQEPSCNCAPAHTTWRRSISSRTIPAPIAPPFEPKHAICSPLLAIAAATLNHELQFSFLLAILQLKRVLSYVLLAKQYSFQCNMALLFSVKQQTSKPASKQTSERCFVVKYENQRRETPARGDPCGSAPIYGITCGYML